MMKANLKAELEEVDFVSTTADIWIANNRSYMGVTVHWINRDTLNHHKAALACKRLRGRHTFDVIAAELEQIHSSYGLLNKVVATVTDNASNFIKAFKHIRLSLLSLMMRRRRSKKMVPLLQISQKPSLLRMMMVS